MRSGSTIRTLIAQIQHGDSNAFGKLYDAMVGRVYRFVYFRVGRQEDAEDLTEQVFVKVWKAIGSYEERGIPFEAWLFRIVRNEVTDHFRAKKPDVPLIEAREVPDGRKSPEEAAEQTVMYEQVLATIPKLPKTYQEIIILKFIEELDNSEISHILEKPIDQVRVLQSRALAKLKSFFTYETGYY